MVTGFAFLSRLTQIAPPSTRFVFLGAGVRLGLPSHPASRRRSCLRLGVSTTSSSRGLPPPIDRPCRAYSRRRLRRRGGGRVRRPIHLPARADPACCARPGGRARAGRPGGRSWPPPAPRCRAAVEQPVCSGSAAPHSSRDLPRRDDRLNGAARRAAMACGHHWPSYRDEMGDQDEEQTATRRST
jgi:hypothetical protein